MERFGGLHVAVNNAGIVNGGTTWELPLEAWHAVLDVNLWGVIHGVRAFVPRILATGEEGHVVNVASMAAVTALGGLGPYTVAKHGVLGLSDVLRADLVASGAPVGVSVVFPGRIRTGMNPIGTVEPETVAANVLDAIARNRPYVFTDDHATDDVTNRLKAIITARAEVLPVDPRLEPDSSGHKARDARCEVGDQLRRRSCCPRHRCRCGSRREATCSSSARSRCRSSSAVQSVTACRQRCTRRR